MSTHFNAGRFVERDALAFGDTGAAAVARPGPGGAHVARHKRRSGGEVVFDPDACRDFVTGFRKRKLARRAAAKADVARRERETRLADRAARRARLREELDLERYDTPPASEGEEEDGRLTAPRLVAAPGGLAATVTVTPVAVDSDLEGGEDEEGDDDEEEKRTAVHALAARPRLAAPPPPAAKKKKRPVKDRRKKKAKKGGGRGK